MALFFKDGDTEELLSNVTPMMAIDYLGIPTRRYGSNLSILCPNPEHADTHYGSCIVSSDGRMCTCFSQCGRRRYNALQILMWQGGYSSYEAKCIMARLSGREYAYEASRLNGHSSEKKEKLRIPTRRQMELIGLTPFFDVRIPVGISESRPEGVRYFRDSDGAYVVCREERIDPWRDLAKDEPEVLAWIVCNKCRDFLNRITKIKHGILEPWNYGLLLCLRRYLKGIGIQLKEMLPVLEELARQAEELLDVYQCEIPAASEDQ